MNSFDETYENKSNMMRKQSDGYDMPIGHHDQQQSTTAQPFDFGESVSKFFDQVGIMGNNVNEQKQLFLSIDVYIFVPKNLQQFHKANQSLCDILDEEPETLECLKYFCEVADYTQGDVLIRKSIDSFNEQLMQKGSSVQLSNETSMYCLRMAKGKKKMGYPNYDQPKIDLDQKITELGITSLSIDYKNAAILDIMGQSIAAPVKTKSVTTGNNYINTQAGITLQLSQSSYENTSIKSKDSTFQRGENINQSFANSTQQTEGRESLMEKNSQPQACCSACLIF